MFFGLETTGMVNTGIGFGAEKGSKIVKLLMNEYENKRFILKMENMMLCLVQKRIHKHY